MKYCIRIEKLFKTYYPTLDFKSFFGILKFPIRILKRIFGSKYRPTLNNLTMEVPVKAKCGFLGKNGAGKTTTIKILLHTLFADKGECIQELMDFDVRTQYFKALLHIGSLVEKPNFYGYLSGYDNLKLIAIIRGIEYKKIDEVLNIVNLYAEKDKLFSAYSTGMKQRLGIAAALLINPGCFILDEPTSGLDPEGQSEIRYFLSEKYMGEEKTLFLSSHQLHEVEKLCDYVVILDEGKRVAQGSVAELLYEDKETLMIMTSDNIKAYNLLKDTYKVNKGESVDKDYLIIETKKGESKNIAKTIITNGIDLIELKIKRQSLEEYFLKTTGKNEIYKS